MTVKDLYKYEREDGGWDVSPIKPETENYTTLYRLIADEGKALTQDGIELYMCIDVESVDGWYEVEYIEQE